MKFTYIADINSRKIDDNDPFNTNFCKVFNSFYIPWYSLVLTNIIILQKYDLKGKPHHRA